MKRYVFALLFASSAYAQSVATTPQGIVVAHDGRIELTNGWNVEGVAHPGKIVAGRDRVAVIDPIDNEAVIVVNGVATRVKTGETPIDGLFLDRDLWLLARDSRTLMRVAPNAAIKLAADPAVLREANGRLYVYCRAAGLLQEIDPMQLTITRSVAVAPFASTFEISGDDAYFVYPRDAKLRLVNLKTMTRGGEINAGAVPVDVVITAPTALTARTLAVADPSAKRVWIVEGNQSFGQAFARGFLRGFLGLGLFGNRDSQFPTGVDRVIVSGKGQFAYDSSSGTLYRFTRSKSSVVAQNIGPNEFTVARDGVYVWERAVRRLHRIALDE